MFFRTFLFLLFFSSILQAQTKDTLRVAVYNSPPFGMETHSEQIGGLMVDLWKDIAKELDYQYTFELTDMDQLITGLQNKKYDVGLGAISITPKRERLVDFSQAVNPSGTGIAVAKKSYSTSFFKKWMPILVSLLELILFLVLMLFSSAVLVYFVERRFSKNHNSERDIKSIADGLWWSAVTMTTVGYGDKVPHSRFGKVLGIVWIFTSIIFFSLFTANASAKLANSEEQSNINTLDDLRDAKVVAVEKSSGEEFLIRENIPYIKASRIEEAIEMVVTGASDAVVSNVPVLKYHNKVSFGGRLIVSDNFLMRNNMGIALQEESPLREKIDEVLLEKISEPKWQHAVYKYIGD